MDKEQKDIDLENNEEALETDTEDTESKDGEKSDDSKDESEKKSPKKEYSTEEKLARVERMRTKYLKELGKSEEKSEPKSDKGKSGDLDYGQKAFLRSYDIKGADELALVKNWTNRTGDELDAIVEDEIFQAKLKGLREARATAEAVPKGTKRSGQAPQDESYWKAKIESGQATLNDIEDVTMRRKVLNSRIGTAKEGNKFSTNPIVMS
jgi:hypothetical protein